MLICVCSGSPSFSFSPIHTVMASLISTLLKPFLRWAASCNDVAVHVDLKALDYTSPSFFDHTGLARTY